VIIVVDLSQWCVTLTEPEEFGRFSVAVVGEGTAEALAAVVHESGLGRVAPDGAHLVVDPVALRALAGGAATFSWDERFEAMRAYAAGKGWVEPDGGILAHIEERDGEG
jgi:hypothetical protein